ncbi:MAG: ECF transporter S component [bacterium]|nr:ECF transporter S component [bacterium]
MSIIYLDMTLSQKSLFISRLALLIALAIVVQMAGLPQPITGPIINALLFTTAAIISAYAGILLGCITPLVALIRGQLPPVLAPLIPVIAVANAILVVTFYVINYKIKTKYRFVSHVKIYLAIIAASITKFLFLTLAVKIIFPMVVGYLLPEKVAALLMTPQLLTALAGGVLFLGILKILVLSPVSC